MSNQCASDNDDVPCSMTGGRVLSVEEGSPAWEAGIEPGDVVVEVDGVTLRDVIDWRWLASDGEVTLLVEDSHGDGYVEVELEREAGQDWGIIFDGALFDGVKVCRNSCTFCFMRQLPKDVRRSLILRDDDYRLSFLSGNFVTLTNLDEQDIERIIEQRLSPLRVSLHAIDPLVRESLIGRFAQDGIANLERLLDAGIEVDAQIVLVRGVNDGSELERTLAWAYEREGIRNIGVVPVGRTRYRRCELAGFDDPQSAREVLATIAPFRKRADAERGHPWVHASDELYLKAYCDDVLEHLPDAASYGSFEMFEDGIGIVRSMVDELQEALEDKDPLRWPEGVRCRYVCGEAMMPYFAQILSDSVLARSIVPLPVSNEWLGGNVDVTGLLSGEDIANAIARDATCCLGDGRASNDDARMVLYAIPNVVLNDDGVTLDGMDVEEIRLRAADLSGQRSVADRTFVVASNPIDYIEQISALMKSLLEGVSGGASDSGDSR